MKRFYCLLFLVFSLLPMVAAENQEQKYARIGKVNGFLSDHVKLTGYGQFGYNYTDLPGAKVNNQFYFKLAMLVLSGDITDNLSWMVDFEAVNPRVLDAYVYYKPFSFFRIKAGYLKTAFTLANQFSPSAYETINWDRVIGAFAARSADDPLGKKSGRDLGIQLDGEAIKMPFDRYFLEYRLGVYSGAGINTKENNNAKDVAAWLTLQPVKGFKIGASAYKGRANREFTEMDPLGNSQLVRRNVDRNREAVSAVYENKNLLFRGEYLWGQDNGLHREGFYAMGQWFVLPSRLAFLGKIEGYDANKYDSDYEMVYTLGSTYHLTAKTRVMLNYIRSRHCHQRGVNEVWAQFQIGF